jgi:hypothetical protein
VLVVFVAVMMVCQATTLKIISTFSPTQKKLKSQFFTFSAHFRQTNPKIIFCNPKKLEFQ